MGIRIVIREAMAEREAVSRKIEKVLHDYHKTGDIGEIKPESEKKARTIAAAIAYREARERRRKGG